MQSHDLTIILSLISLGFFGGFTHCSGMCGPFVLSQVSNRLSNIRINEFNSFKRLQGLALLPYHLGRITTYSFIGFFCSFLTKNIKDITNFQHFSGILMLLAAFIFSQNLLEKKFLNLSFSLPKINFLSILKKLFENPQGLNGYLLGIILGFIPCGLLYGAFTLSAIITQPTIAALAMFLFGLATIPALFITGYGGYIFLKFSTLNFKLISKIIVLINIITLIIMGVSLILN